MATAAAEGLSLLERNDALARLRRALTDSASGSGRLLLVAGEAGVGKTSLVRAFCAELARDVRVLRGGCDALFTPRPLGPFLELAADANGEFRAASASGAAPHALVDALVEAGEREPIVVVLEDIHWATRRASMRSACSPGGSNARRFSCSRPSATTLTGSPAPDRARRARDAATVCRITLEPLSEPSVVELAAAADIDAGELHRSTGGNPFFVTEVWRPEMVRSETVRDAVLARVASLSEPARPLLDAVAIVPQRVELWLLEALASTCIDALEECLVTGTLRASTAKSSSVTSWRDAPSRSRSSRAELPACTASRSWRSTPPVGAPDAARLAHHAEAAAQAEPVLGYAIAAAERCEALGAHREAAEQYARAFASRTASPTEERASLLERQSDSSTTPTSRRRR